MDDWMYLASDEPGIIARINLYYQDLSSFRSRLGAFRKKYDAQPTGIMGSETVEGVTAGQGTGNLPGRWRKPDDYGIIRPYKTNREGIRLIEELNAASPTITLPGLPMRVIIDGWPYGRSYTTGFLTGEGRAWARIGNDPAHTHSYDPTLWHPVMEWEFKRAMQDSDRREQHQPRSHKTSKGTKQRSKTNE